MALNNSNNNSNNVHNEVGEVNQEASSSNNSNNNVDIRRINNTDSSNNVNRPKKYRNILPAAKEGQGRSILQIIYDRSIRGPKGIDPKYRINNHVEVENDLNRLLCFYNSNKDNFLMRHDSNLSNASPSSVIITNDNDNDNTNENEINVGNEHGDEHQIQVEMMEQNNEEEEKEENTDMSLEQHHYSSNSVSNSGSNSHEQDSLSEILNSDEQTANASISASTIGFRANDSLSEILNSTNHNQHPQHTQQQPPTSNNNQSIPSMPTIPNTKMTPPPRLKMNSYPSCHFTEIRNYSELCTVTKFNSNYLCLKTRDESNNYNRRSHGHHNTNNSNNSHHQHPRRRHPNHHNEENLTHNQNDDSNDDDDSNSASSSSSNNTAISTISIAFSPDGRTVASTHGDHSVKITCCHTGALIRNLEGHPRTPWTVKYHPTKSNIVASGCLGFQVRVWDWNYGSCHLTGQENDCDDNEFNYYYQRKGVCLNMIRLQSAIISLSFHPTGSLLAVASGHSLHLWVYDDGARREYEKHHQRQEQQDQQVNNQMAIENNNEHNVNHDNQGGNTSSGNSFDQLQRQQPHSSNGNPANGTVTNGSASAIITQIRYEHTLRCVHFPPGGDTIILGGVNPPQGREASYSLRLWDFDIEAALNPQKYLGQEEERVSTNDENEKNNKNSIKRRDALSNFRTFVPRALLYNDGGFDVSPDGSMLCGCAEIFLPDGVDSAMEIIEKTTWKYNGDDDDINTRGSSTKNTNINDALNDSNNKEATNNNARSPRRKMNRPHGDKKEKRRKEVTGGRVVEASNEENNDEVNSPLERPSATGAGGCRTPPNPIRPQVLTSPPSPPGRRWSLNLNRTIRMPIINNGMPSGLRLNPSQNQVSHNNADGPTPPPLPPSHHPHQRSGIRLGLPPGHEHGGRFVPHVVVVNLDRKSGKLGQLLEATPLGSRASSVTCVKFSPSAEFCLLGYGVREHASQQHHGQQYHPVTALYRVRGGLSHIATMNSTDDDVNIARFHPHSGQGFVYGTKQGRVRVLSPRPWNQYYEY
jgi:activator-of-BECN1-regulated-autophagy protein 1